MSTKNFYQALSEAKKGEEMVAAYLRAKGWEVIDVSNVKEYQKQDVDFIIKRDGKEIKIEVKYDSVINRTNNFFIEIITNDTLGTPGWFKKTTAEFIFYINKVTSICYVFSVAEMRDYIEKYKPIVKSAREKDTFGNDKYSHGYCVNVNDYISKYNYQIINLGERDIF